MSETSPRRRTRLEKRDWIEAAIAVLAEGGLTKVAVEPLARALGVTKGSFYHHFASLDDLVRALVASWEEEGTDALIRELEALADPRERLARLVHASWERLDHLRAEAALAAAAANGDARVAPAVARVTAKRLAHVERTYRALGHTRVEARHHALHAFASFLGTVTLAGAGAITSERELRAHVRFLEAALVPARGAKMKA